MATVAKRKKKLTLSREVKAFARERGLTPHLPAIVEALHRVFSEATKFSATVHDDPEIAGLCSLLFEVEVPWRTGQLAMLARQAWHEAVGAACPATLRHEILLLIRRRP